MNECSMPDRLNVLLVEDNEHDRVAFRRAFTKSEVACQITECQKAEEAFELLQSSDLSFDLIVMDFGLPGMSGMEFFREVHSAGNSPPFVMLTGSGSEPLAVEALKAGFADYLVKDPAQSYLQLLPVVASEVVRRHHEKLARERAEQATAASQKRLAQTLESITDAYFALDNEWRIVEINHAAERQVFARPAAELMGEVIWDLYPQARNTEFYRNYQLAVETGKPVHFEGRSAILDKWWETHVYPHDERLEIYLRDITERKRFEAKLRETNEQLEARVAERTKLLTDAIQALEAQIVERKNAERALRESKEKYSSLVGNSLTGIFIEQKGRIIFANQRLADIYGYQKEELTGMDALQLVHPEDRRLITEMTERRLQGLPVPAEYDARAINKAGEMIWVQRRNALIEHQGAPAILANHIDITSKKQAFDTLKSSQRKLRFLSSRLLSAQEDERKRIARELHDSIGSSLSSVKFGLESLLESLGPGSEAAGKVQTLISLTHETIDEVRRLMSDLRPAMLDDLGLESTIMWFCRRFESIYPRISVEHRVEIEEEQIPEHLKIVIFRILQEAMQNIAKYSGTESATVSLTIQDQALQLAVADIGKGFDLANLLPVDDTDGGLGLTSMRERTEFSGGTFDIRSTIGEGTRVQARWPYRNG